jgi:Asp-tRNA(Asn)/Glu-tRNA(Gln) amidotransferase A subunit family amidase
MCLGAIGSQTGGSITRPASFCGVAGCKPTYGTVSTNGVLPLASSMDHPGPIARSVRDLALLLSVMSDEFTHLAVLAEAPQFRPRLGHLAGFFQDKVAAEYQELIASKLRLFAESGAIVAEITGPDIYEEIVAKHRTIMACEAAGAHLTAYTEHKAEYGPRIGGLIEEGLATRSVDYIVAQQHQKALKQTMLGAFQDVDVLITPATLGPAPDAATTGDPRANSVWSYLGYPTVSFPIGLSADGLPLAIQLIGPPHSELTLFQIAIWCESLVWLENQG